MARTILTDELWNKIHPLLPPESGYWGRPSKSHRIVLEGILWIFRKEPHGEISPLNMDLGVNPVIPGKKNRVEKLIMISTFTKSDT